MTTADVSLRGHQIAAGANVQERDGDAAFISLPKPPPVRAVLDVTVDGARRGFRVRWVDETGRGGDGPGVLGEWIETDELVRVLENVGSEGLAGGVDHDAGSGARPAPVVVTDEPSGVIDTNEAEASAAAADADQGEAAQSETAESEAAETDAAESETAEAAPAEGDAEGDKDSSSGGKSKGKRTKKRKGRKRG